MTTGRLAGKSALIMGGSHGIGAAVAQRMSLEGARVTVADVEDAPAGTLDSAIERLHCDVTDEANVASAIASVIGSESKLDILVNNAGVGGSALSFVELGWDEWHRLFSVNLNGVAYGMKHALPHMLERGYGRIINTSSQLAHKPAPFNAAYCAAKAAVVALTSAVAQEVANKGITVNCVCPGPTDTRMWKSSDSDWKAWKSAQLPIRRPGTPQEMASAYIFLAGDDASYMIGQSVSPNGGDVMW
jgi:NAD(P)-dependent dehydrogenase (short-subunit alcohol dehydrogenase family)